MGPQPMAGVLLKGEVGHSDRHAPRKDDVRREDVGRTQSISQGMPEATGS